MTPAASTRSRGARVEAAAREHLVRAGLSPVAANANYRFGELDLVMCDGAMLVFVEVRYRADDRFGGGAQSITHAKRRKLVQAASAFLAAHSRWADASCRFDVVDASGDLERPTLAWIRDAFRADDA
ncbi:YraN family protein [Cognatilysobacter terrigena]|uniref:YraN family protein n=1 Tax=Cognatilysobacter terrigena TaxID=2488749 RepID=UPI001FE5C5C6|nr:YraN family protein [Lysobacter terrigena]